MKILSNKKTYLTLILSAIFLPGSILASSVYISTNQSEFFVGDTIVFGVRIDSEGKDINVAEGEVLLDHAADVAFLTNINISDSIFPIWPRKPLPSEHNSRISFAGGAPSGLVVKDATIFSIVLRLEKTGKISLSPNNIEVYLNDGKGTKDEVSIKNLIIDVLPKESDISSVDDWGNLISNDKTAPEPFEIYPGQDDSVFDGKKFISFNTTDKQSGISYYEVAEGRLSPVRSNNTYVLQEQDESVKITVIAYDSAGNNRKSIYKSEKSHIDIVDTTDNSKEQDYALRYSYNLISTILLIPLLLVIIVLVVANRRKKRK